MNYLNINQVLAIHNEVIEQIGGLQGIRDMGLLESAVARPRLPLEEKIFIPIFFQRQLALDILLS